MVSCNQQPNEDGDYVCGWDEGDDFCIGYHCEVCSISLCSPDCGDEYCARTRSPADREQTKCMLCAHPLEDEEYDTDLETWVKDGKKIEWDGLSFSYPCEECGIDPCDCTNYSAETFEASGCVGCQMQKPVSKDERAAIQKQVNKFNEQLALDPDDDFERYILLDLDDETLIEDAFFKRQGAWRPLTEAFRKRWGKRSELMDKISLAQVGEESNWSIYSFEKPFWFEYETDPQDTATAEDPEGYGLGFEFDMTKEEAIEKARQIHKETKGAITMYNNARKKSGGGSTRIHPKFWATPEMMEEQKKYYEREDMKWPTGDWIWEDKDEIFNVEFNEWADQELMSHGKNISFKDWAQDEGMKHGNTEITEWAQHEDESHDARYGAETLDRDKTWANRENMSYFFVFEEDERGIRRQTPYRTKEGAIKAGEKPDEIYEYRGLNSISKEERNEQKKDRREWTERGEKGEFFEDFWWKGEMGRYANSDYERLHHSLYDSSTENDEKDGFYEKTILPTNPSRMEQEVNQAYAQEYGISERLGELLNSSRSFGMYISQRAHPDTVKKYRQKILDGFDSYKPQSEREKKIVKRVRENMAKRGVKGPSPSYWGMSQGVLRKPELSYVYADYYDNPIPFMGYELTDDERKIIVPASLSAESTDSFWDWEDPTDGKDLFKLTKLEDKVLTKFKGLLYNWGSEPGYSDVFEPELRKKCNITKAKMSEVLSSLVDKDLVALHDHEFEVENKRSRWGGYKLVTQVLVYPLANMYVYFNEYEGLEGHWRETPSIFGAEKKRSGILSDPFEEASLDSGGTKKVLLAIGLGIIGYFGYNKWK